MPRCIICPLAVLPPGLEWPLWTALPLTSPNSILARASPFLLSRATFGVWTQSFPSQFQHHACKRIRVLFPESVGMLAMRAWMQWHEHFGIWVVVRAGGQPSLPCHVNAKNMACISQGGLDGASRRSFHATRRTPPSHLCGIVIVFPDIWRCPWQLGGLAWGLLSRPGLGNITGWDVKSLIQFFSSITWERLSECKAEPVREKKRPQAIFGVADWERKLWDCFHAVLKSFSSCFLYSRAQHLLQTARPSFWGGGGVVGELPVSRTLFYPLSSIISSHCAHEMTDNSGRPVLAGSWTRSFLPVQVKTSLSESLTISRNRKLTLYADTFLKEPVVKLELIHFTLYILLIHSVLPSISRCCVVSYNISIPSS